MKLTYILFFILFSSLSHANVDKNITMATDPWAPYYDENIYNQGPVTEITDLVLKKLGYQLNVKFIPWKRAVEHTKKGSYDAILGAYFNADRAHFFWYSDAVATSQSILFSLQDNYKETIDLKDFSDSRICVMNGYFYSDEFTNSHFFSKVNSNSLYHCFERLIAHRVDYVVANKLVGQALLNKQFSEEKTLITALPIIISQQTLHILWSKKIPSYFELNKSFNRTLQELKESDQIKGIWKKHGFEVNEINK